MTFRLKGQRLSKSEKQWRDASTPIGVATPSRNCTNCLHFKKGYCYVNELFKIGPPIIGISYVCYQWEPKRSKYNVDLSPEGKARRTVKGHVCKSEGEARYYRRLLMMEKVGVIEDLQYQPVVILDTEGAHIKYTCDFSYKTISADLGPPRRVWDEFKGKEGETWRKIKKLWAVYGRGELRVTVERRGNFYMKETIHPQMRMNLREEAPQYDY